MVYFYKSDNYPNIFYYKLADGVNNKDAVKADEFFQKNFMDKRNVIAILEISEEAVLIEKSFLNVTAKMNQKNKSIISEAYVLGLKGIRKMFFKTYRLISPTAPAIINISPSVSALEAKLKISLNKDFYVVNE